MMDTVMAFVQTWWPTVAAIVTLCAAVAAITPSKSDDRIVQLVLDIINKLGLNIGQAKNKDDV